MATNKKRFFSGARCGSVVEVTGDVVKDVDTGEVYKDLTIKFLENSDEWFEYETLGEARNQKSN